MWGVSSASVFSSWIAIELNLLFLLPIMAHHSHFYGKFSAVKYFIIQRISGLLILTVIVLEAQRAAASVWLMVLLGLLFLKLGAAPFYQWVLSIGEHQSWWVLFVLLTIQKLIPFYFINRLRTPGIMYVSAAAILILPPIIISLKNLKKIIIISSTYLMMGILIAMAIKTNKWKTLILLYSLTLTPLLGLSGLSSGSRQVPKTNEESSDQIIWGLLLLNMLGMPPLPGFLIKVDIAIRIVTGGLWFLLMVFQVISVVLIFIYLKIMISKLFSTRILRATSSFMGPLFTVLLIMSLRVITL